METCKALCQKHWGRRRSRPRPPNPYWGTLPWFPRHAFGGRFPFRYGGVGRPSSPPPFTCNCSPTFRAQPVLLKANWTAGASFEAVVKRRWETETDRLLGFTGISEGSRPFYKAESDEDQLSEKKNWPRGNGRLRKTTRCVKKRLLYFCLNFLTGRGPHPLWLSGPPRS